MSLAPAAHAETIDLRETPACHAMHAPGEEFGQRFSTFHRIAVGDLDSDGFEDLATSYYFQGDFVVHVVFGPLSPTEPYQLPRPTSTVLENQMGSYLAIGDLTGDGHEDLVLRGATLDVVAGPLTRGTTRDMQLEAPEHAILTGRGSDSMLVGDVNDDGQPDLVLEMIEVPSEGLPPEVAVVFGPIVEPTLDFSVTPPDWVAGFGSGTANRDLAVADMNGDGVDDLVVGDDVRSTTASGDGGVDIFLGPLLGGTNWDLSSRPADASILPAREGHDIGHSVHAGDIDGDGAMDLVIGAPSTEHDDPARFRRGEIIVVRGPFPAGRVVDLRTESADIVLHGPADRDGLGTAAGVLDVNADGRPDLVITNPRHRTVEPDELTGALAVLHGPFSMPMEQDLAVQPADVVVIGPNRNSEIGARLLVEDMSGDGRPDLVALTRGLFRFESPGDLAGGALVFFPPHFTCGGRAFTEPWFTATDGVALLDDGRLRLAWTMPPEADTYELYSGPLTTPFVTVPDTILACGLPSDTLDWTSAVPVEAGSRYYLVAARTETGRSYGERSDGQARPPAAMECP